MCDSIAITFVNPCTSPMSQPLSPKNVRTRAVNRTSQLEDVISPGQAHFAMVEKEALKNLDQLMRQNVNAARLAVSLIRLLEAGTGGVVIISRKSIQELLNVSMPTVDRCIAVLVEGGWVHRVKIGGAYGFGINKKVAWVGKLKDAEHAVFTATVFASKSEQDEYALNPPTLKQLPIAQDGEDILPSGDEPDPPAQGLLSGTELVGRQRQASSDEIDRAELEALGQKRLTE